MSAESSEHSYQRPFAEEYPLREERRLWNAAWKNARSHPLTDLARKRSRQGAGAWCWAMAGVLFVSEILVLIKHGSPIGTVASISILLFLACLMILVIGMEAWMVHLLLTPDRALDYEMAGIHPEQAWACIFRGAVQPFRWACAGLFSIVMTLLIWQAFPVGAPLYEIVRANIEFVLLFGYIFLIVTKVFFFAMARRRNLLLSIVAGIVELTGRLGIFAIIYMTLLKMKWREELGVSTLILILHLMLYDTGPGVVPSMRARWRYWLDGETVPYPKFLVDCAEFLRHPIRAMGAVPHKGWIFLWSTIWATISCVIAIKLIDNKMINPRAIMFNQIFLFKALMGIALLFTISTIFLLSFKPRFDGLERRILLAFHVFILLPWLLSTVIMVHFPTLFLFGLPISKVDGARLFGSIIISFGFATTLFLWGFSFLLRKQIGPINAMLLAGVIFVLIRFFEWPISFYTSEPAILFCLVGFISILRVTRDQTLLPADDAEND